MMNISSMNINSSTNCQDLLQNNDPFSLQCQDNYFSKLEASSLNVFEDESDFDQIKNFDLKNSEKTSGKKDAEHGRNTGKNHRR